MFQRSKSSMLFAALAIGLFAVRAHAVAPTPVTGCNQIINGPGELTGDLDCSANPTRNAVNIHGGSLAMNGFTIRGGLAGVECIGPCRITGPGTITEAAYGIQGKGKLDLRGVNVTSSTLIGVQCFVGCRVSGPAVISDNGTPGASYSAGISSPRLLKLSDVTLSGNWGYGAIARSPDDRGTLVVRDAVVTANTYGLYADHAVKVSSTQVTGNAEGGVILGDPGCAHAGRAQLKNSTVTGNAIDAECGVTEACADVMTCKPPHLTGASSCGTSYVTDSGLPGSSWNVCTSD